MFNIKQLRKIFRFAIRYVFSFFSGPRLIIPQTELSKIIKSQKHRACLAEPVSLKGNVTISELLVLNLLVKAFNPKTIFELGTFDGRTTLNLALNACPDTKVYTIDLPKDRTVLPSLPIAQGDKKYITQDVTGARFLNKQEKNKISQLYGDTATFDFSPYFNTMDMIFVDGSHSFEYVLNDSKIALKLLRNGRGLIVWHDYGSSHKGVAKALNKLQLENPEFKMFHIKDTTLVYLAR